MRIFIVLALLLFPLAVLAQWYEPETGAALPDNEWRKSAGDIGAALVVTAKAEEFLREWYSTAESHAPKVQPVDEVKRGDIVAALLFFSGCGEPGGSCSALADFTVLRPDGSVYGAAPGNPVWSRSPARKGIVLLSQAHLRIRIEPQDPLGKYSVLAVFREPDANRVLELRRGFEVVE